ncbi:hypothetical protein GCM10025866_17830 [Naasia aerilata]|uniref:Uncharacterized protein n=1 Tax=Naasia aerilata TaxID=1162966 RepID=A0ABN6XLM9_9MICO|nr:hypothetical protein GCM10025866_17830 [Naasia aerilata]
MARNCLRSDRAPTTAPPAQQSEQKDAEKDEGRSTRTGPHQDPSQGDNPNITLTRPQITRPLTLVGECPVALREGSTDKNNRANGTVSAQSVFTGTGGVRFAPRSAGFPPLRWPDSDQ